MKIEMPDRPCVKCGSVEFYVYGSGRSCKECMIERNRRKYRSSAEFRAKDNQRGRKRYQSKKEEISQYWKEYRKENRETIKKRSREYYRRTKKKQLRNAKIRKESNSENFLRALLNSRKGQEKRYPSDPRKKVSIDLDFLVDLYKQQEGKCNLSGLSMVHHCSDLKSISIDRIDSLRGYHPGNVQLVCKFLNLAKNHHSDSELRAVLNELRITIS